MPDQRKKKGSPDPIVPWFREQWVQVRGNVKWDAVKTGVLVIQGAFWAFVCFLRQGPAWQVYGILALETVAVLLFLFWPTALGRVSSGVLFGIALLLGVVAVEAFSHSGGAGPSASVNESRVAASNSAVANILGSSNVDLKNNSDNRPSSISGSPFSINTIGQSGGNQLANRHLQGPALNRTAEITVHQ